MAIAYGSITLVDIDDLGQLSVVPESNQPGTVIYDPNIAIGQQYRPDWSVSNLILTPIIYYGGIQKFQGADSGISVSWIKRIENTEENVKSESNGNLVVNTNPFIEGATQITYICVVTYSDPSTMGTYSLTARGQITFSLVKNASAISFQIVAPEGNVIVNGENDVVLQANLFSGANLIGSNAIYQWSKWDGENYADIDGATNSTYTVIGSQIDSYISFRCVATYESQNYEAFLSVYDKTDPLQVYLHSTLGDKLLNSAGHGMVYALVYRNGQEIDAIKTTLCGTSYPNNPDKNSYFYYLDSTAKAAILKQYDGSTWITVESPYTGTYKWTLRDSNNNVVEGTRSGKVVYIDGAVIDTKMTFDIEVTI